MAAQWYYAHKNKQQGPVEWNELCRLASTGKLERTDMVWREGMPDWKKASTVEGLFSSEAVMTRGKRVAQTAQADRVEEVDDDEDMPRRRKKKKKPEGMTPGALAGIIGGCVAAGLVIIIIIIVLVVRSGGSNPPPVAMQPPPAPIINANPAVAPEAKPAAGPNGPGAPPAPGAPFQPLSYTVTLADGQQNSRSIHLQQGQRVSVTVTSRGNLLRVPDVDLFITRSGDPNFFLSDEAISPNCFLTFVAPATDLYHLEIDNLGPGSATSTVNVK